ncbi:hypothetical protein SESBI_15248 [Sesbania bispinosa]|nr:hypothetical protein SESBI_15248 [Sesbania bispinosa]
MWEEHPEVGNVIKDAWSAEVEGDNCWERLRKKTGKCTSKLKAWHKENFKKAGERLCEFQQELEQLQSKADNQGDLPRMQEIRKEIIQIWKQQEAYWAQRSRLKWLNYGDKNIAFFHASTVQRRDRNRLVRIRDGEDQWVEGQKEISNAVLQHFWKIYTKDPCSNVPECIQATPKLVPEGE